MNYAVASEVKTNAGIEGTLFPGFPHGLAAHYSRQFFAGLTGVSFRSLPVQEPIERTASHTLALQQSLDSAAHMADRERLLPYITGRRVLELGTGTGSVLQGIAGSNRELELLVGVEFSSEFFMYASAKVATISSPLTCLVRADATKMELKPSYFDTVILASIVHEVKSYYGTGAVENLMQNVASGLRKGGRAIILDGFRRPGNLAKLELLSPEAGALFADYMSKNPRQINYARQGNVVLMPATDAVEFAAKIQFDSWEGELAEEYYPFTLAEYSGMLARSGLENLMVATFPEEIDRLRLTGQLRIRNTKTGSDELSYDHNAMIVATKTQ